MSPTAADLHPSARLASSERKIRDPFQLDPTMCFYSPQTNVAALEHPRVQEWLSFVTTGWEPTEVPGADAGRIALLVPCTKYKPYFTSREHRAVNGALLAAGWQPSRPYDGPAELTSVLDEGENPDVLAYAPLVRDGVVLDRFVISEPMGLVPYEHTMYHRGEQSPATSYDDPGLFAGRGTSVSPERDDCTATERADGTWAWGPGERAAYVEMHNAMADVIVSVLDRVGGRYDHVLGWVSPGLTHRSFLADTAFRPGDGLPSSRRGPDGPLPLRGVLDALPGAVEILPTRAQTDAARAALPDRLAREGRKSTPGAANAVFARGDGNDTPLGLPELTAALVARIDEVAQGVGAAR
ncbi:MAG: hypothetical protein ACI379_12210 [Nocardioides sp.]|uniref:hypothetical protein n=1 Tax=Nocardioides sp. TaxID=35761 RepID=UPI003EFFD687